MVEDENGRLIIRKGDTTDHGGTVITGAEMWTVEGRPVARIGDQVICPKCDNKVYEIVEGNERMVCFNRPIAFEGHRTSCGARLIPSLRKNSMARQMQTAMESAINNPPDLTGAALVADASGNDSFITELENHGSGGFLNARDLYEEDKNKIISNFRLAIDEMINEGVRFDGSGFFPALWNNFRSNDSPPGSWTGGEYYRCYPQSFRVLQRLYPLKNNLNLRWGFKFAHTSSHYWVEAVPLQFVGFHGYEVIVLDSLYGSVDFKTEPHPNYTGYNPGINPNDPTHYVDE